MPGSSHSCEVVLWAQCLAVALVEGLRLHIPKFSFPRRKIISPGVLPDNTNVRFSRDVIDALLRPAMLMSLFDRF